MAYLYITELQSLVTDSRGNIVAAANVPPIAEQQVGVTGSSAQSAAFNPATKFIMVQPDEVVSLAFGANPTAVVTAHRMAAGETRYYGVQPGQKVAVIANS